jgi:hypothetical protein
MTWTPLPAVVARGYFIAAEELKKLEEPLEAATEIIQSSFQENFDSESSGGQSWEELAESTKTRKARDNLDPRILRATGALYEGATQIGTWDVAQESHNEALAVLEDPTGYGAAHVVPWRHHSSPRGTLPERDWTYISDETLDEVEQVFYDWLDAAMENLV